MCKGIVTVWFEIEPEVLAVMKLLSAMDQMKLMNYLTKQVPQLCNTQFFAEFVGQETLQAEKGGLNDQS